MNTEEPIKDNKDLTKKEYNSIANEYVDFKYNTYSIDIEEYTIFNILYKNWEKKDILDLACGNGHNTEKFMKKKANSVLGMDISDEMIKLADKTYGSPNVSFLCGDAAKLNLDKQFDIVTAFYLICFSKTRDDIAGFAKAIKKNLKPDGIFIGINNNPDSPRPPEDFIKYGIHQTTTNKGELVEGDELNITLYDSRGNPTGSFTDYWFPKHVIQKVFKDEGLDLKFIDPQVDPIALNKNKEFYDTFMNNKFFTGMVATHIE